MSQVLCMYLRISACCGRCLRGSVLHDRYPILLTWAAGGNGAQQAEQSESTTLLSHGSRVHLAVLISSLVHAQAATRLLISQKALPRS